MQRIEMAPGGLEASTMKLILVSSYSPQNMRLQLTNTPKALITALAGLSIAGSSFNCYVETCCNTFLRLPNETFDLRKLCRREKSLGMKMKFYH